MTSRHYNTVELIVITGVLRETRAQIEFVIKLFFEINNDPKRLWIVYYKFVYYKYNYKFRRLFSVTAHRTFNERVSRFIFIFVRYNICAWQVVHEVFNVQASARVQCSTVYASIKYFLVKNKAGTLIYVSHNVWILEIYSCYVNSISIKKQKTCTRQ